MTGIIDKVRSLSKNRANPPVEGEPRSPGSCAAADPLAQRIPRVVGIPRCCTTRISIRCTATSRTAPSTSPATTPLIRPITRTEPRLSSCNRFQQHRRCTTLTLSLAPAQLWTRRTRQSKRVARTHARQRRHGNRRRERFRHARREKSLQKPVSLPRTRISRTWWRGQRRRRLDSRQGHQGQVRGGRSRRRRSVREEAPQRLRCVGTRRSGQHWSFAYVVAASEGGGVLNFHFLFVRKGCSGVMILADEYILLMIVDCCESVKSDSSVLVGIGWEFRESIFSFRKYPRERRRRLERRAKYFANVSVHYKTILHTNRSQILTTQKMRRCEMTHKQRPYNPLTSLFIATAI